MFLVKQSVLKSGGHVQEDLADSKDLLATLFSRTLQENKFPVKIMSSATKQKSPVREKSFTHLKKRESKALTKMQLKRLGRQPPN